jgi:hypothetical protein
LAKILPLESADNVIVSFGSREGTKTVVMPKETFDVFRTPFADIRETTMCWSLSALLGVLPYELGDNNFLTLQKKNEYFCCYEDVNGYSCRTVFDNNPIDVCYKMILKLHDMNLL